MERHRSARHRVERHSRAGAPVKFQQLLWYARRARTMEQGELRARLAGALGGAADYVHWRLKGKSAYRRELDPRRFAFCRSAEAVLPDLPWNFAPTEGELASLLAGRHHALGFPWAWRPERAVWHRAPDTQRLWPETFSDRIDHRPGNAIGDARVMWEPNRLQQLVDLALVTRLVPARAGAAAAMLQRQLLSWFDANPMRIGANYTSAMECALRIVSVCIASDLTRPFLRGDDAYWTAAATITLEHAEFVNARLSLYSSLGNHTVAECTGLYLASLLFDEAAAAPAWEARAREVLERAAHREIMADGGPGEQALHYHAQVLDLLEIALRIGRHFGRAMGSLEAIHRHGVKFLARFASNRAGLPRIGDDDDGHALSRYFAPAWAGEAATPSSGVPVSSWSGGGYTIVRAADAELVFDHGPLGMAPNFGHGHADALAICLRIQGAPVLIDPGTYAYGAEAQWRSYFRSTAAHNTVTVDGRSQAREAGPFLWTSPYDCTLAHNALERDAACLVAWHDGYRSLGVRHTRAVRMAVGSIVVIDRLEGAGAHELALRWHFAETARLVDGAYALAGVPGFRCVARGGEASLLHGSQDPPGGWKSERYGRMTPASTLALRSVGALPHEFVTCFVLPGGDGGDLDVAVTRLRGLLRSPSVAGPAARVGAGA